MREEQIERVKTRSRAVEKAFDNLLNFLGDTLDSDERAVNISKSIPGGDCSVSDLRARTASIAALVKKFDDKGGTLTPLGDFVAHVNSANAVINSIKQCVDTISSQKDANGGLQAIDYENFNFTWKNGQVTDLQGQFKTIFDNIENYTKTFQEIFQSINPSRASFNFAAATKALSQALNRGNEARENLRMALKEAQDELDTVKKKQANFDALLDDARAKQHLLSEQSAQAVEALTNITAKNDDAKVLATETTELRDRIKAYGTEFEGFQNQLDEMKTNHSERSAKLKELVEKFEKQETSFDEMITRSDQMLSGSTVAGLASEFGTIRTDLDQKLTKAHQTFNWAIGILFASALPLMLFVFAPFLVAMFPDNPNLVNAITGTTTNQTGWHYFGQVIARFVILLPAIWYVTFCTARYNAIFRLKEHYSYKYSMAVAVDGFKKQAPEHEGMIAALVFEQLAFNPVDKLSKKYDGPEDPPNPIAKLLLEKLRKSSAD